MLKNLFNALNGSKTNLGLIGLGAVGLLAEFGHMDNATAGTLTQLLYVWTGVAIAHKADKVTDALKSK